MSKKDQDSRMVYSTDSNYRFENDQEQIETLPPKKQNLKIQLDKKQRRGKQVTLVTGFAGSEDALKELAKILKSKCGVGGTAKDGEIIIQGEFRKKIKQLLTAMEYRCKIAG